MIRTQFSAGCSERSVQKSIDHRSSSIAYRRSKRSAARSQVAALFACRLVQNRSATFFDRISEIGTIRIASVVAAALFVHDFRAKDRSRIDQLSSSIAYQRSETIQITNHSGGRAVCAQFSAECSERLVQNHSAD
jgi:hypothetical protein